MIQRGFERRNRDENDYSFLITNHELLQICKTEDVITHVEKQQTKYLAHIARRSNANTAKRLLFNNNKNHKREDQSRLLNSMFLRTTTQRLINSTEERRENTQIWLQQSP